MKDMLNIWHIIFSIRPIIFCCTLFLLLISNDLVARDSWLPAGKNPGKNIRLLECAYQDAILTQSDEIGANSGWEAKMEQSVTGEVRKYTFTFTAKKDMENTGVAVAFDRYNWTSDNYVMIPAIVYNGNRQRIVNRPYATGLDRSDYYRKDLALTSNPIPQLSPEFGTVSRLEVLVNNAATPNITFFERAKQNGVILLTDQGIEWKNQILDHGLIVEETPDRSVASFVISAPGVRELKPEFIGFSKSPDRGINVKKDDKIVINVAKIEFPCNDVTQVLSRFMKDRKMLIKGPVRNLMPMSEILSLMTQSIDDRYLVKEQWEYYCNENADWLSYGWVGGLMNTFPMLALGDAEHLRKVKNTFNFAVPRGRGKSGYYYGVLGSDGNVLFRDAEKQNTDVVLTLRNGEILYWMVKQFMLLKEQNKGNEIDPNWELHIRILADALIKTWEKHKTWGNYLNIETGDVAVYNTAGGAIIPAALALASVYYNNPTYLKVAREGAEDYYNNFAVVGFTAGGCGDILQNSDSQTAIALATSLITLYEMTGERAYLKQAADLANLCATWTVSFPYILPENTPLAKLRANLTGAVWASTQNKHGAPGFCLQSGDVLFKLYRETGDTLYAELLRDVMHGHTEGIQPNGRITERLTYCDADSRGSRGDGGSTGWNEACGAMMALEIPGIYVRTDNGSLYVFDHVTAKVLKRSDKQLTMQITNPTLFDATVTVFAENAGEAAKPLGDNAFLKWKNKVTVKAGKTIEYSLKY